MSVFVIFTLFFLLYSSSSHSWHPLTNINDIHDNEFHQLQVTDSYTYSCYGNCKVDVNTTTTGGTILMGGGTDVDAAFVWLIKNSGGGDILVLRTSGTDAYNQYIYGLGTVNSVSTIICNSRDASADPFVLDKVSSAEGLFFSGGDQYVFYTYWSNTPLADEVNKLITVKNVTVGGTSAGMMIQSQLLYTAQFESVNSSEALSNPYSPSVTIGTSFIKNEILEGLLTDTHFYERDRMGRLVTFLARIKQDRLVTDAVFAIACDEQTAVLVSQDGYGTIVSPSKEYAYFLYAPEMPSVCKPGQPLSYSNVDVYRMGDSERFDLILWEPVVEKDSYFINANNGNLTADGNGGHIY